MLLHVPAVIDAALLADLRKHLAGADWSDGRATVGAQGAQVKRNEQLRVEDPLARELGEQVRAAVLRHPLFFAAALPLRVLAPLFNRYADGGQYGMHVDGAVMHQGPGLPPLRSDLAATLFISAPEEYDGGELVIDDTYGEHEVKLDAGDLVLYPASSLHRVEPVTRGARVAAFFWTQSLVRQDAQRTQLFQLDQTIQRLRARLGDDADVKALTGHYHNLLRQWAET